MGKFQSSPGQKAGCNPLVIVFRRRLRGFNPHPARRPGATPVGETILSREYLFQSSPGQKAGCNTSSMASPCSRLTVSILTRPEGRVQPGRWGRSSARGTLFQSSPGQKAGCNQGWDENYRAYQQVSILTRPEGRVQPVGAGPYFSTPACFNPHPARRPGATRVG